MTARFDDTCKLAVDNNAVISQSCRFDTRVGIGTSDDDSVSANVTNPTADNEVRKPSFVDRGRPVEIGDRPFLGTDCKPGVAIGIGAAPAGFIVTRSVGPPVIASGNPARFSRNGVNRRNNVRSAA